MEIENTVQKGVALRLTAHDNYSYAPRTQENAQNADVTVAFAVDFTTAGERLTHRASGSRYVGIPFGSNISTAANQLVEFLQRCSGATLNVAGNGIYTLGANGVTQAQANQWVYEVLANVTSRVKLTLIRSGGQTGIDQAGLIAGMALGVPTLGFYPKSFRRRLANGQESSSNEKALYDELTKQMRELELAPAPSVSGRQFHEDGTQPLAGEIFVFGSNLAGRHGKGSALIAKTNFGAIYGQGEGIQGQSYGIPTKDGRPGSPHLTDVAATLPLPVIKASIDRFIAYAVANPEQRFFVVRLGCALAAHHDSDIAPMFVGAPANCNMPEPWRPWLEKHDPEVATAPPINIFSGSRGLGGALTNMSERAKEKGCIKHSYPVTINGRKFVDSEEAYQVLKVPREDAYNDGLMIDIIALKFLQNPILAERVQQNGGAAWLAKCSHFTQAKSVRFQAWEGQGNGSRFIRVLVLGYVKAITGAGPQTRVVHVDHAPYDVYIGRDMSARNPKYTGSVWRNPYKSSEVGSVANAVRMFSGLVEADPAKKAAVVSLRGRTLGCWCKNRDDISAMCHGEVLAAMADGRTWVPQEPNQKEMF